METTINERVKTLIKSFDISKASFASNIGVSPTAIQSIVNGRNKPGYDILEGIATAYPQVSTDWLIKGEGAMFRDETLQTVPETKSPELPGTNESSRGDEYLMRHLTALEETNRSLARTVEAQSAQITTLLGKSEPVPFLEPEEALFLYQEG